jgi:uncharacterized protein involved in type VI secretion and phage assembly
MNTPLVTRRPIHIFLDDLPLPQRAKGALIDVTVRQALAAPTAVELTFAYPDPDDLSDFELGRRLRVMTGPTSGFLFEGLISTLTHDCAGDRSSQVTVVARDALQALAQRQNVRALENLSAASCAAMLAADLGVDSRSVENTPERRLTIQHEQTDLDLLCDLAGDSGLYPVLREKLLLLVSLAGDGEEPLLLAIGKNLLSARVSLATNRSLVESKAQSLDLARVATSTASVGLARQDREEMRNLGREAPNARRHLTNRFTDGDSETEALAQAMLDRAAAREGVAEGVTEGDPALTPGRLVTITGIAPALEGRYIVTRAVHRFTQDGGYLTEFSTEPPARPARSHAPMVVAGRVIDVADPDRLGRCRVALPTMGDVETGWMQVLTAGAGAGRGLTALPHTDDDVLIICPDGDPARGVVLGGLYGTRKLPRDSAGASPRGVMVRSGNGQALELSGKGGTARLLNRGGSLVELAPDRMRLAAACDLLIEAPGRRVTIRAADIHFERG